MRRLLNKRQPKDVLRLQNVELDDVVDGPTQQATAPTQAPTRRLTDHERALMTAPEWSGMHKLKLEDPVAVVDHKSCILQGVVAYVGEVHFEAGIWVGVQLTGPSVGRGYNDGSVGGKRYFGSVGKGNGVFCHISRIQRRAPTVDQDSTQERLQQIRQTPRGQLAELKYVEQLKKEREVALLKTYEERRRFFKKGTEDIYIKRLKQKSLQELRMSREEPLEDELLALPGPRLKFAGVSSALCQADYEFMKGLQDAQQNFVLTDPTIPDNPVTMASQAFQVMTKYPLSEILGKNCRFLQGPKTSKRAVARVRLAIEEGSDCSICLLNYKKDGTTFWNEFFITALRDNRGRIKNYIGVLCEVSEEVAALRNKESAVTPTRSRFSPPPSVPKYVETYAQPEAQESPKVSPEIYPYPPVTANVPPFRLPDSKHSAMEQQQQQQCQSAHSRSVSAMRERFAGSNKKVRSKSVSAPRDTVVDASSAHNKVDPTGIYSYDDPPSAHHRYTSSRGRGRQAKQTFLNYPRDPSPTGPNRKGEKASDKRTEEKSRGMPRVKSQPTMHQSRSKSRGARDSPGSGPAMTRKEMRREFTRHYFSNSSARFSNTSQQSPSLTESSINSSYPDSNLSSVEISPGGQPAKMLPSALKAKSYELGPGVNIVQLEVDWPGDSVAGEIQR